MNATRISLASFGELSLFVDTDYGDLTEWADIYKHFTDTAEMLFVGGAYRDIDFDSCSNKIRSTFIVVDETSYNGFFVFQAVHPKYNEVAYCRTVIDHCTGENKQFDSYEECIEYNRGIPDADEQCRAVDLIGLGHSRYCRIIHQHMVRMNPVHCHHTGLGGSDPTGGAHCFDGECDLDSSHRRLEGAFSTEQKDTFEEWQSYFRDVGSHECVDGIYLDAYYRYQWRKPVAEKLANRGSEIPGLDFDCLILGKEAYLKVFEKDADGISGFQYKPSYSEAITGGKFAYYKTEFLW
jgi:hypothetical protein